MTWLAVALLVGAVGDLEQLHLDAAARGSLLVGNGQTLRGGTYRTTASLQYSHAHLKDAGGTLLRDRFAVTLSGAAGITRWLEFSAELPIIVHQTSERASFAPASAGFGTPFVHAKVSILHEGFPVAVWASLGFGIPVGSPAALGDGGFQFLPRVNVGRVFTRLQLGAQLEALVRDRASQLAVSLSASQLGEGMRGEVSVRGFVSLSGAKAGLELLFGGRYPIGNFELFFLGGPGFGKALTTPTFRVYGGLAFGNGGPPLPRCTESIRYPADECPDLDQDGDGIPNGVDLAPSAAEDKDGFQDEDGVPDPDNDADGVLDGADKCPNEAGENQGCPVVEPPTTAPREVEAPAETEPSDPQVP